MLNRLSHYTLPRCHFAKKGAAENKKASKAAVDSDSENQDINMSDYKERMSQAIDHFKQELSAIRAGRVHPSQIEHIQVVAYNDRFALRELASISIRSAQMLAVNVSEETLIPAVVNALQNAGLNLTPRVEGKVVVIQFPKLSQEYRLELAKQAGKKAEHTRNVVRGIRQDALSQIKEAKDSLPKDEVFRLQKEIQAITDGAIEEVNKLLQNKEKDINSV